MQCYIDNQNISQAQKESLQKKHEELWSIGKKALRTKKDKVGNEKIVLSQRTEDYANDLKKLAQLNREHGVNGKPVFGLGGKQVFSEKGKDILRDVVAVSALPYLQMSFLDFNTEEKIENLPVLPIDKAYIKQSNNVVRETSFKNSEGVLQFDIRSGVNISPNPSSIRQSPVSSGKVLDLREALDNGEESTYEYICQSIIQSFRSKGTNHNLVRAILAGYPQMEFNLLEGSEGWNLYSDKTSIYVGKGFAPFLIGLYQRGRKIEEIQAIIESGLTEELIHIVASNVATKGEMETVYSEMSDELKDSVRQFYRNPLITEENFAHEYIRMIIQKDITGTITENQLFEGDLRKKGVRALREIFYKAWQFLSSYLTDNSEATKVVVNNIKKFIQQPNVVGFYSGLKEVGNSIREGNVQNVFKGRTSVEAKTLLNEISQSKHPLAPLAKKLSENLNRTVMVYLRDGIVGGGRGEYYAEDDAIAINRQEVNPKGVESTILHEIIHAITHDKLHDENNKEVLERFTKLFNAAKNHLPNEYNTQSLDEFITGVFTNAEFIDKLKKIDAINIKHASLWDELLDTILSLFGIKKGTSLYEQAFNVGSEITQTGQDKDNRETGAVNTQLHSQINKDVQTSASIPVFTGRLSLSISGYKPVRTNDGVQRFYSPLHGQFRKQDVSLDSPGLSESSRTVFAENIAREYINRLSNSDEWYGNAFKKIGGEVLIIDSEEHDPAFFALDNTIIINLHQIKTIPQFTNEYLDRLISEEVIHLVHNKLITEEENKKLYNSLSKEDIKTLSHYYRQGGEKLMGEKETVYEYVRMLTQKILFDSTSEDEALLQKLSRNPTFKDWILKLLREIYSYLNTPTPLAKNLAQKIADFTKTETINSQPYEVLHEGNNRVQFATVESKDGTFEFVGNTDGKTFSQPLSGQFDKHLQSFINPGTTDSAREVFAERVARELFGRILYSDEWYSDAAKKHGQLEYLVIDSKEHHSPFFYTDNKIIANLNVIKLLPEFTSEYLDSLISEAVSQAVNDKQTKSSRFSNLQNSNIDVGVIKSSNGEPEFSSLNSFDIGDTSGTFEIPDYPGANASESAKAVYNQQIARVLFNRLLHGGEWYSLAFRELQKVTNSVARATYYPSPEAGLMFQLGNGIYLNTAKLSYNEFSEDMVDKLLSEEVIHLAQYNMISVEEEKQLFDSLTEKEKNTARRYYHYGEDVKMSDRNLLYEFLRMKTQQILYGGATTEDSVIAIKSHQEPLWYKAIKKVLTSLRKFMQAAPSITAQRLIDKIIKYQNYSVTDTSNTRSAFDKGFGKPPLINSNVLRENFSASQQTKYDYFLNYLSKVAPGFKIELVEQLDAKALTDFTRSVIQLSKDASIEDFTEEVLHVLFESLPKAKQDILLKQILDTKIYGQTFEDYKNDPEYLTPQGTPDFDKIKREACVKLLNEAATGMSIENLSKHPTYSNSIIEAIQDIIQAFVDLIKGVDTTDLQELVDSILDGSVKYEIKDLTDLGIMKSVYKMNSSAFNTINDSNLDSQNISELYFPYEVLFNIQTRDAQGDFKDGPRLDKYDNSTGKHNGLSPTGKELLEMIKALNNTGSKNLLNKIKIAVEDYSAIDPSHREFLDTLSSMVDPMEPIVGDWTFQTDTPRFRLVNRGTMKNPVKTDVGLLFQGHDGFASRTTDANGFEVVSEKVEVNGSRINGQGFSETNRVTEIRVDAGLRDEFMSFFKNLTDEEKKITQAAKKRLLSNLKTLEKTGILSKDTDPEFGMSLSALEQLKRVKSIAEFETRLGLYFLYFSQMEDSVNTFQKILDDFAGTPDPNNPLNEDTVKRLNKYQNLLNNWKTVLEQNYEVIRKRTDNPKLKAHFESLRNKVDTALTSADKIVKEQLVEDNYRKLQAVFDQRQLEEITRLEERLRNKGVPQAQIDERTAELKLQFIGNGSPEQKKQLIRDMLDGKSDVGKELNSITKGIVSLFDNHLIGAKYANDPIIAALGLWNEDMLNKTQNQTGNMAFTRLSLNEKIKAEGGEFKVGDQLGDYVDTYIEKQEVDFTDSGDRFKRTTLVKVNKRIFFNQYGDWMHDELGSIPAINTFDGRFTFDGRLSHASIKIALDNLKELEGYYDTEALQKQFLKLKKQYSEEYLTAYHTEQYLDVRRNLITSISNRFNKSEQEIKDLLEVNGEEIGTRYNAIKAIEGELGMMRTGSELADLQRVVDLNIERKKLQQEIKDIKEQEPLLKTYYEEYRILISNYHKNEKLISKLKGDLIPFQKNGNLSTDAKRLLNNALSAPDDKFFFEMFHLHHALLNPTTTGIAKRKEDETLFAVVDEHMTFFGNETWRDERNKLFEVMGRARAVKNAPQFVFVTDTSDVIKIGTGGKSNPDSFVGTGAFQSDAGDQSNVDIAKDLLDKHNRLVATTVFSKIEDGKAELEITGGSHFLIFEDVQLESGPERVYFLMDKKGHYISIQNGSTINNDMNAKWEQINEIEEKYRDKNNYTFRLSEADQIRVTTLEQEIEDMKTGRGANPLFLNLSDTEKKDRAEAIKDAAEELDRIQEKFTSENYYLELEEILNTNNSSVTFKRIIDNTKGPQKLRNHIIRTLKDEAAFLEKIRDNPNKTVLELREIEGLEKLTQADLNIAKWINRNHVHSLKTDEFGNPEVHYRPSHFQNKYTPKKEEHVDIRLSDTYMDTSVKEEAIANKRDTRGNYLPKKINKEDKLVKGYKALTGNLKDIHKEWVEGIHIDNQVNQKAELDNARDISKKSFLWYDYPNMIKKASELGLFARISQWWTENFGSGLNTFEEGETSSDTSADDAGGNSWVTKKLGGLKEGGKFIATMWQTNAMDELATSREAVKQDFSNTKTLPVKYTNHIESGFVTSDVFSSVMEYNFSLTHQTNIYKNIHSVKSMEDTLRKNSPKGTPGDYSRLKRFEAFMKQTIYGQGLGSNNVYEKILRAIRKLMVFRSQGITNPAGNLKNLTSSLISNYIRSMNVDNKWGINRAKTDFTTTAKAFYWAQRVMRQRLSNKGEETKEMFILRTLNPQNKTISESVTNSYAAREFWKSFDFFYAGMSAGENVINTQVMLDITSLFKFRTPGLDGEFVELNYEDIWENIDGRWQLKPEIYYKNSNELATQEAIQGEIRKHIHQQVFTTTGHSNDKGAAFGDPSTRTVFTMMSFIIPLVHESMTNGRKDWIQMRQVNNYHLALIHTCKGHIDYMIKHKGLYWDFMTDGQKRDFLRGFSVYLFGLALLLIIRKIFDFDPEEDDALKNLNKNSWEENLLLYATMRSLDEIEGQGIVNFQGKYIFPLVTRNIGAVFPPLAWESVKSTAKMLDHAVRGSEYKIGNKKIGIEKGDSKALRELQRLTGSHYQERYNFAYQTEIFYKLNVRQ